MLRAAVLQMCSGSVVQHNLAQCTALAHTALEAGANFLVLPENFALMGHKETNALQIMEPFGSGLIQDFISKLAQEHNCWVLAGSVPLQSKRSDRLRAASLLYQPNGYCVARYDKIHLFDVTLGDDEHDHYQESATIEAGNSIVVADTEIGRIGLSICYDVRFPELYRNMLAQSVNIITVPAAFTVPTGRAHWQALLQARAIENLCYVIAANQCGTHENGRQTWGHSMIIDAWGNILTSLDEQTGVACADIDLKQQAALQRDFPARKHIKLTTEMTAT